MYHGMPEDAKLRVIANRSGQKMAHVVTVWVCLLDAASRHKNRGTVEVDSEQIAVVQDIDQSIVEAILQAFREKNMIGEDNRLTKWDTRQYLSEAERAKKYREGKKEEEASANESSHAVTPRHTPSHEAVTSNAESRKNGKKAPDTDSRVQIADTESRITEGKADAEKEADLDQKKSDKRLKTHTEKREREREKQQSGEQAAASPQSKNHPQQPALEQMLDIWNTEVQSKLTKGQAAKLTARRKEQMACRWKEDFQQDIRAWRYYCEIIANSQFCLGKREGKEGKAWTIDLSWAVASSDHVARIMEGGFSGGNHPPKPPACNVPELVLAWDTVLEAFQQKYGKPTCRSWLGNTTITRMQRICDGPVVTLLCPSPFVREWLTQHYLPDITRWFVEATRNDARVNRVELITEG
jgi:hypothetical protein